MKNTWSLTNLLLLRINTKWVYKKKKTPIKQPLKFKVRIVMKGYEHCACMFAPIVRWSTIWRIIALLLTSEISFTWTQRFHLSMGILRKMYNFQPHKFVAIDSKHKLYKFHKVFYDLQQVSKAWYNKITP